MLLRRFTDIYPKELARDMREFFNSLLGETPSASHARSKCQRRRERRIRKMYQKRSAIEANKEREAATY